MKFETNINYDVKVKLTNVGREILKDYYQLSYESPMLKADEDGYNTFQMWSLMNIFGKQIYMCEPLPFETKIIILDGEVISE